MYKQISIQNLKTFEKKITYGIISYLENYICNWSFGSSLCNIKKFRYYQNNTYLF